MYKYIEVIGYALWKSYFHVIAACWTAIVPPFREGTQINLLQTGFHFVMNPQPLNKDNNMIYSTSSYQLYTMQGP